MDIKTSPRAANAKIVMPHPTVLSGRPYEKVNLHCFVRASAIQPVGNYTASHPAGRFLWVKMMAIADHMGVLSNCPQAIPRMIHVHTMGLELTGLDFELGALDGKLHDKWSVDDLIVHIVVKRPNVGPSV